MTRAAVLSEEMWARIEPLLPSSDGLPGGRWRDHRTVLEGIVWRYRTGSPWRDVPERFGPWQTLWKRHDRWAADGTWDRLLGELSADADATAVSWIGWSRSTPRSTERISTPPVRPWSAT